MKNVGKGSVPDNPARASLFDRSVFALTLIAFLHPLEWSDRDYAWGLLAMLLHGLVLVALLGVLAVPSGRLRIRLGLRAEGANRLVLAAVPVLGLLGLGFDFLKHSQVIGGPQYGHLLTRCNFVYAFCILFSGYALSQDQQMPVRVTRSVAGLHVLAALGLAGFAVAQGPWDAEPSTILWLFFAPCLGAFAFIGLMAVYVRRQRLPFGHCPVCRYNLTGNVSGRCPECGTPIAAGTEAAEAPEVKNAG